MCMSSILTDTHRVILMLKEYGFTGKQAEGITNVFGSTDVTALVTRSDLTAVAAALKSELDDVRRHLTELQAEVRTAISDIRSEMTEAKAEISGLRADVRTDMAEFKSHLIKWMAGLLVAHATLLLTVLR